MAESLVQQTRNGVRLIVAGALAAIQAEDRDPFDIVRETRQLMDEVVAGLLQMEIDCQLTAMAELLEFLQQLRPYNEQIAAVLTQCEFAEPHAPLSIACRDLASSRP